MWRGLVVRGLWFLGPGPGPCLSVFIVRREGEIICKTARESFGAGMVGELVWGGRLAEPKPAFVPLPIRAMIGANVPVDYTVAQYIADLRAIRSTGSATAETSFYPPIDRLFNAVGRSLKPAVLFSTQLRNSGAGLPDGGFFPQPKRQRRNAEPELLQNPERGVVEIKPADYNLDALAAEPQTIRYLRQYGLVLITNLRQFRLLGLGPADTVRVLESYTLAATCRRSLVRTAHRIRQAQGLCSRTFSLA